MKNGLSDLNNHLFMALERLNDENLTTEQIEKEAKRSAAMVEVSDQIIGNAQLQLKAATLFATHGESVLPMLPQVGHSKPKVVSDEG